MNDQRRSADTMSEAIALSSPSGRMSARARRAAEKRLWQQLFPDGLPARTTPQPTAREQLLHQAQDLRELANRGMKPRAYRKRAAELEAQAEGLTR